MADKKKVMQKDNPAARLYRISDKIIQAYHSGTTREAFRKIFNAQSPRELFSCFEKLHETIDEIKQYIELNDISDRDHYLYSFPKIEKFLDSCMKNLDVPFHAISNRIDEHIVRELKHCALMLDNHISENRIKKEELENLKQEVESLIEQVLSSSYEAKLKKFILEQLHNIKAALKDYEIIGNKALRRVYESNIGAFLLNVPFLDDNKDKEEGKQVVKILGSLKSMLTNVGMQLTIEISKAYINKCLPLI
jgi:hypothetical protein